MSRPTIVLAEDHPHVAEQLQKLLSTAFDVVAVREPAAHESVGRS